MGNFFRKLWPYLLAIVALVLIALIGDGRLGIPFFNKDKVDTEDTVALDVDTLDYVPEKIAEPETSSVDTADSKVTEKVIESKKWRLVVGSFPEKERAERLAAKLDGTAELRYVEYMSTYRVVYGSYVDLAEAQQAYVNIQNDYPESWVVYF